MIDENEVLRYLNWTGQELDKKTKDYLNKSIELGTKIAYPKYIYRKFNIKLDNTVSILDTNLVLEGKDIKEHLQDCDSIYLLATTLGAEFDREINIWKIKDLNMALYLEAVGTTLIEDTCDKANEEIETLEKNTKSRFSCGYGDLPISIQPKIIEILNANRAIGLTCTSTNIMIPRKSVTAIIGVGKEKNKSNPCDICNLKNTCYRRERGIYCGKHSK